MKGFNLSTQGGAAGSTGGGGGAPSAAGGQPNNGSGGAPELGLLANLTARNRTEAEVNATSTSSGNGGEQSALGLLRGRSPMTKLVC